MSSSLAGPVNGAEIPNRISLSVIPRMVGAGSLPTVASRAGAPLPGCATVGAIGRLAADELGLVVWGAVGAIARRSVGELTCSGIFELSGLDVSSTVFVPDPGALPNMDRNSPVNNNPIIAPNTAAMTKPPLIANHPNLRGRW
jgi:hypothetical protein